jgi:hypothetical protein
VARKLARAFAALRSAHRCRCASCH